MDQMIRTTKIKWNEIAKVGFPPAELRKTENGCDRIFLCRGEYSMFCCHMHDDGSGFGHDHEESVVAWAVVEGF